MHDAERESEREMESERVCSSGSMYKKYIEDWNIVIDWYEMMMCLKKMFLFSWSLSDLRYYQQLEIFYSISINTHRAESISIEFRVKWQLT